MSFSLLSSISTSYLSCTIAVILYMTHRHMMADTHTMSNTAVYIDVPTHISIAIIPRECDGTPHLQIYLPDEKQLPCHLLRFCHWLVEDKLRTVVATIEKGEATESVMEDEEVFHHINKPDFLRDHNEGTFKGMGGGAVVDVGGLTDDGSLTPMRMWAFQVSVPRN